MADRLTQSLTEIENDDWGEPTFSSSLVKTIHALRHKPIGEFTIADLRICIGQAVGLAHLIPLALAHLERDPFAEGDYYPGDLLWQSLRVDTAFWTDNRSFLNRMLVVAQTVIADCDDKQLYEAASEFVSEWSA